MVEIGNFLIYVIMFCVVLGALAAIRDPEHGLGAEFIKGLHSIGPVFIPVAGIMASIPYLSAGIKLAMGPLFSTIGSDPAIAATSIIAVDMGGYQLADGLATSRDAWIIAMLVGYTSGATIAYLIPVGLTMLRKDQHKYLALGVMAGFVSIPVTVLVAFLTTSMTQTPVRDFVSTSSEASYLLSTEIPLLLTNLLPLIAFCTVLALGVKFVPDMMVSGFLGFGRVLDAGIKLVLACSIVEYFTGFFALVFGSWGFDPIIADEDDLFRALEIAGYIGIMLAGTFPLVYLVNTYLDKPMKWLGEKLGMSSTGATGFLMVLANVIATYHLFDDMRARDKVLCVAFAVCAQAALGDHLAFTANFQPTMIAPILFGKLAGGAFAVTLALVISVPAAERFEKLEMAQQS